MTAPTLLLRTPWLLALFLAACGGGGGGGDAAPASTAISSLKAPADFKFESFTSKTLTGAALLQAVGGFNVTDAQKTYVKVWYVDAAGEAQQLMFMTLAALQSLDAAGGLKVQVPGGITRLKVEIYNASASKTGEVTL